MHFFKKKHNFLCCLFRVLLPAYVTLCCFLNFGTSLHIAVKKNSVGQEYIHQNTNPNVPAIQRRFNPLVLSNMLIQSSGICLLLLVYLVLHIESIETRLGRVAQMEILSHSCNLTITVILPVIFACGNNFFRVHMRRSMTDLLQISNRVYEISL